MAVTVDIDNRATYCVLSGLEHKVHVFKPEFGQLLAEFRLLYFLSHLQRHADCRQLFFRRHGFCDGFWVCDYNLHFVCNERSQSLRAKYGRRIVDSASAFRGREEHGIRSYGFQIRVEVLCIFCVVKDHKQRFLQVCKRQRASRSV